MTGSLIGAITHPYCRAAMLALFVLACDDKTDTRASAPATASAIQPTTAIPALPTASAAATPLREHDAASRRPKKTLKDCPPGNAIEFESPEFEAAVRLKLQKPDGPITKTHLKSLRSLNLSQIRLDDLDVCLFTPMTGLKELFLGPGDYDDLSPIAGALQLQSLGASRNKIQDLSTLSRMTKMDRLDLAQTAVEDLSPLASMKELTELMIDGTSVSDLSPLKEMTKLERLGIKNTKVKDVSPLRNAEKLQFLYVAGSPVADEPGALSPVRRSGTRVIEE